MTGRGHAALAFATAGRVLRQVRNDRRTTALMLIVPCVLMGLLAWVYQGTALFDLLGAPLLGIFPFVVMFLVTSVTTLRERTSGTLERLLTTPLSKASLVGGYALAFAGLAVLQAGIATAFALWVCGLDVTGSVALLVLIAVVDALLGTALGLFVSAFAATEFQAVQFLPALILPQFLLCGLLKPRDHLSPFLHAVSDALPLSYAVDAMRAVTAGSGATSDALRDVGIVALYVIAALGLAAPTLRRRTP